MGYLKIDNRAAGGGVIEFDTVHCRHCQAALKKKKWDQHGGFCTKCDGPLCGPCGKRAYDRVQAGLEGCEPWQRKIEAQLKENERQRIHQLII